MTGITFTIPRRGDKAKLARSQRENARQNRVDDLKHLERHNPEERVDRLLERIKADFRLSELPHHIECFDNSNIQGHQSSGIVRGIPRRQASQTRLPPLQHQDRSRPRRFRLDEEKCSPAATHALSRKVRDCRNSSWSTAAKGSSAPPSRLSTTWVCAVR